MAGHALAEPRAAEPPVPPGAEAAFPEGSREAELRLAVIDLREALRPEYGAVDVRHYALPDDAAWSDIEAFYETALGEDWSADADFPERRVGYRLRVWRKGGSRQDVLAAGFVEAPETGWHAPMLILATPRRAGSRP